MATTPRRVAPRHLRPSDIQGAAQLAAQATIGVARITEGVHQSVWSSMGVPGGSAPGRTRGLTGLVYRSIESIAQLVGHGMDKAFRTLQPLLETAVADPPNSAAREAVLAALNGVMGDRLVHGKNPLATPMGLLYQGQLLEAGGPLAIDGAASRVVVMIHGLCMNDLQWHTVRGELVVDHGQTVATAMGATPLYLRYNSGQHISQNGHRLSALLEQLARHWPMPLESVTVLAHSMGGLVIRSAVHSARAAGLRWPDRLKSIVFLGTPHHGAPLERAGHWIDQLLGATPWSRPFTRLTGLRSAGITDLRYGFVTDADWDGKAHPRRHPDTRQPVPLPRTVACYAVAATTAAQRSRVADRLLGDGLVPLHSALGTHADPRHDLAFAKDRHWITYRMNHLALLSSPLVTHQLLSWLAPATTGSRPGP